MNKTINLGNRKFAMAVLKEHKEHDYSAHDVRITNAHIMSLNDTVGYFMFRKDSLYIHSHTLWEIMQPVGGKGNHNYHGLTEEDVFMALSSIKDPQYILISKDNRYSFISVELSHFDLPLMIIIETNASLIDDAEANINKVVTIYPKDEVERIIAGLKDGYLIYPIKEK